MRRNLLIILFLGIAGTQNFAKSDKLPPATLNRIAGVFACFGGVISNPHDLRNVMLGIIGIITNILSLAADTSESSEEIETPKKPNRSLQTNDGLDQNP